MCVSKYILIGLIVLGGCATTEPAKPPEPLVTYVPVRTPCAIEEPKTPDFNFPRASVESTLYEKVQTLLADRLLHLGYEEQLRTALRGCKQ